MPKIVSLALKSILLALLVLSLASCDSDLEPVPQEIPDYLSLTYREAGITETVGHSYGSHEQMTFDLYEVERNPDKERPLVIVSPESNGVRYGGIDALKGLCKDLAKRGYVVALVYNRLMPFGSSFEDNLTFWFSFVHDQKAAVRFFKKNAAKYRISEDKVFINGYAFGAVATLMTSHMELKDLEEMTEGKDEFMAVYGEIGLEGTENLGVSSTVKGVSMMTTFISDINIIDANGPAMMFIHNEHSTLSDGTKMMGKYLYSNDIYEINLYGPDLITAHSIEKGYKKGDDLEFILMDEWLDVADYSPVVSTLTSDNWEEIASFYHQNLD